MVLDQGTFGMRRSALVGGAGWERVVEESCEENSVNGTRSQIVPAGLPSYDLFELLKVELQPRDLFGLP